MKQPLVGTTSVSSKTLVPSVPCVSLAGALAPEDSAIAAQLTQLFADAQNGMRRVIALGLFAWELKELRLKHGQFGLWLSHHCPDLSVADSETGKPRPSRSLSSYMELTKNVLEAAGFTVGKYLSRISNVQTLHICHGGNFLLLPDSSLGKEALPLKEKICSIVDGKTARQLTFEFKQMEESGDGLVVKRGRAKGQGGATKAQRIAAKELAETARLDALEARAQDTIEFLLESADDQHLGLINNDTAAKLLDACDTAAAYLRRLKSARS